MVTKAQADAFGALSLSGFSTKPDAVMLITRRHDMSNECRGRYCIAMCYLCEIATKLRFSSYKMVKKSLADAFDALYLSAVSQPNRMQLCLLLEDMIYATSVEAEIVLLCVVCA